MAQLFGDVDGDADDGDDGDVDDDGDDDGIPYQPWHRYAYHSSRQCSSKASYFFCG